MIQLVYVTTVISIYDYVGKSFINKLYHQHLRQG